MARRPVCGETGEEHFNVISAFIKSMRGSRPDAAVYWLMRMIESGDDPLFLLRRMLIFASEDIGNADPRALEVAVAADVAFRRIGMPEGMYPLAQAALYLATAPKSNACKVAWQAAQQAVHEHGALPVPLKLRNAVTKLIGKRKGTELDTGMPTRSRAASQQVRPTFRTASLRGASISRPTAATSARWGNNIFGETVGGRTPGGSAPPPQSRRLAALVKLCRSVGISLCGCGGKAVVDPPTRELRAPHLGKELRTHEVHRHIGRVDLLECRKTFQSHLRCDPRPGTPWRAHTRRMDHVSPSWSVAQALPDVCCSLGLHNANIGEVSIALSPVESVSDDEMVGDGEALVVNGNDYAESGLACAIASKP